MKTILFILLAAPTVWALEINIKADVWGDLTPHYKTNQSEFVSNLFKSGFTIKETAMVIDSEDNTKEYTDREFLSFADWNSVGTRDTVDKYFYLKKQVNPGWSQNIGSLKISISQSGDIQVKEKGNDETYFISSLPKTKEGQMSTLSGDIHLKAKNGTRLGSVTGYDVEITVKP